MRFLQLPFKASLVAGNAGEREEAILKVARQQATVLPILERLSLRVQQPLDARDDGVAMRQEELEKLDMRLERHARDRSNQIQPKPRAIVPRMPAASAM